MPARKLRNNRKGATLVETPAALFIFFFFMLFPLIDLAVIGLRCAIAYYAAVQGAHRAALASSFKTDQTKPDPATGKQTITKASAITAAIQAAQDTKGSGLAGTDFSDQDIKVQIVGVPLKQSSGLPLIFAADRQPLTIIDPNYVYEIQVTINAQIQPFFIMSADLFGPIPGLTVPIPLTVSSQQVCENTDGLAN